MTDNFIREILKPLESQNIKFDLLDNELNKFDRYTYHLKLSMLGDFDILQSASQENLVDRLLQKKIDMVVVAESGVTTGFNIIDCEITDVLSPNFRSRTAITTEVKITLAEPYSLTLPDKLYLAGQKLGVKNWRLGTLLLELWFIGYDQNGKLIETKADRSIYKLYLLTFTDFTSTLTETGTTYRISAIADGDLGFRNAYYTLPISYTYSPGQGAVLQPVAGLPSLGSATRVKDFFADLEKNLNDWYVAQRGSVPGPYVPGQSNPPPIIPLIIYRFQLLDQTLADQEINFSPAAFSRRLNFVQGPQGGVITAGKGTSISNVVDDIMSSLQDVRFFFAPGDDGKIRVPTVECRTANVGWDDLFFDYVREVTFFIGVKETYRWVGGPEYEDAYRNPASELGIRRLEEQAKLIKKTYAYYYTGNNTEILSLNVEFNNLHIIPLPYGTLTVPPDILGQQQRASIQSVNLLRQQLSQAQREIDARLRERNVAGGLGPLEQDAAERRYREAVDDYDRIAAQIAGSPRGGLVEFYANVIPQNLIDYTLQDRVSSEIAAWLARQQLATPRLREFAESLQRRDLQSQQDASRLTFFADPRDITNYWTRQVASSGDSESRRFYASVVSQIYDRIGDSMTQIDLEIRGDPWWLGRTGVERRDELLTVRPVGEEDGQPRLDDIPAILPEPDKLDRFTTDSMFMILLRAGITPDESTGYMNLRNNVEWFHAIYIGMEVTHVFRDGKFTQKIHAIREPINNLQAAGASPVSAQQQQAFQNPPGAAQEAVPAQVSRVPFGGGLAGGIDL